MKDERLKQALEFENSSNINKKARELINNIFISIFFLKTQFDFSIFEQKNCYFLFSNSRDFSKASFSRYIIICNAGKKWRKRYFIMIL